MKNIYAFVIVGICCCFWACNNTTSDGGTSGNATKSQQTTTDNGQLTKLSKAEVLQKGKEGTLSILRAKFKNQSGQPMTQDERKLFNKGEFGKDYYVDGQGKVKEVRVRPATIEDKFLEVRLRELSSKGWKKYPIIDIDCNDLDRIIAEAGKLDQERNNYDRRKAIDSTNQVTIISIQVTIISIIEKCGGFPSKSQLSIPRLNTIWLLFQHADPSVRVYYYDAMLEAAKKGDLDMSKIALMQDRIMVGQQAKQIFGSQTASGDLYPLEDPHNVNKRRKEYGMEPIEEFVKKLGIDFKPENYL